MGLFDLGGTPGTNGNAGTDDGSLLSTLLPAGLSAAAGFFPTPTTTTTNGTSAVTGTQSQQNNINFSPQIQALLNQLTPQYARLAGQGTNLQPYQQQGEQQINANAALAQQAVQSNLAARGLSTSPVAAAMENTNNLNRVGQINTFQQQLPLLQQQLQKANLGAAGEFAASVPHGTSSTGNLSQNTTSQQTQTQQSGGGLGGLLAGLGSFAGPLASGLAMLSDKELKENIEDDKNDHLGKLLKLRPKTFNYKGAPSDHASGFIAQDLEKVLPNLVQTEPMSGLKLVKYHELIPKIVGAIQTLHENMSHLSKNTEKKVA